MTILIAEERQYIGKWIHWKRKSSHFSQEEFLEKYPLCSRKTLSLLENGKGNLRQDLLEDVLLALDIRLPDHREINLLFWNQLAQAYEIYDEKQIKASIRSIQKTFDPNRRFLWDNDLFEFSEIFHDFIFHDLSSSQISSLWRYRESVWPSLIRELALSVSYRIHLRHGISFTLENDLKKSGLITNQIAYGYFLWENDRHHSLSLHIANLEQQISFEENPIRMFDLWILKLISLSSEETEELQKVWRAIESHKTDLRLAPKAKIHLHNLALAFFEKNELEKAVLCLSDPNEPCSLALQIIAVITFAKMKKQEDLTLWLTKKADPADPQFPYFHYFQLKYQKQIDENTLIDVLIKDVWPIASSDSYFRPVFEEEIRFFARKTRRYKILALLDQ